MITTSRPSTACGLAVSTLLILGLQPPLRAATSTGNIAVNATVSGYCTITTSPLTFGAYDPVVVNAVTALDATGSLIVECTQGESTAIGIGLGGNAAGATRRMVSNTTSFLSYELYQDPGRTTVWGTTGSAVLTPASAPSFAPRSFTVYGRVAPGQDVPAGAFTDSAVATVTF